MRRLLVLALAFASLGAPWSEVVAQGRTAAPDLSSAAALPKDAGALAKHVRLARRRGEAETVLVALQSVAKKTLRDERVHGERIQALLDTQRFSEADQLARLKVGGQGGQAVPLAVAMTRMAFRRGDLEEAEENMARVRALKPQQLDLSVLELRIAIRRGEYPSASRALGELKASLHDGLVVELEVDLLVGRAAELMAADDLLEQALRLLKDAVDRAPERVDARSLYVRALARWQRAEQGEAIALEGLKSAQGAPRADLLHALGFLYLGAHREAEAVALFEEALALSPSHALARVGLARASVKAGDVPGARQQIADILAADADDLDALLLLADIESSAGDWDKAAAALESLLEVKSRHLKGLWLLSRVRARQRRLDEVQDLVDRYEARKAVLAEKRQGPG